MQTHSGTHINLLLGPYITSEHVKSILGWDIARHYYFKMLLRVQ